MTEIFAYTLFFFLKHWSANFPTSPYTKIVAARSKQRPICFILSCARPNKIPAGVRLKNKIINKMSTVEQFINLLDLKFVLNNECLDFKLKAWKICIIESVANAIV